MSFNENMQKKEKKLPKVNQQLGLFEKLVLIYQGKRDGRNKNFNLQNIDGKEVFISHVMSQEMEAFHEARDNLLNRRFIAYKDIESGKIIKGATFVTWIDYLESRIECLNWRIISAEKVQEYYSWKNAVEVHKEALSTVKKEATDSYSFIVHTKNEINRLEREMRKVVIASQSERKENINTLYKYLEEKESMVDFMESHLEPIFDHTISRIGYYYGVASRCYKELTVEKRPNPRELFKLVCGEEEALIGERYDNHRSNAKSLKTELEREMKELTTEKIEAELNNAI